MASSSTKRTRSERVASLKLEPSQLNRWLRTVFTGKCLLQVFIALMAAVFVVIILQGWKPPFAFREGDIPQRDVIARVEFEIPDVAKTSALRDQARSQVLCIYENNPEPVQQLGRDLRTALRSLNNETPLEQLDQDSRNDLQSFLPANLAAENSAEVVMPEEELNRLRQFLTKNDTLEGGKLDLAVIEILKPIAESGILTKLSHTKEQGSQRSIQVLPDRAFTDVAKVRRTEIIGALRQKTTEQFQRSFADDPEAPLVAKLINNFLVKNLPESTLSYNNDLSEELRFKAEEGIEEAMVAYSPSVSRLAQLGKPITREEELPILQEEYNKWVSQLETSDQLIRLLAFCGMLAALYMLCGLFIHYNYDSTLLTSTPQLLRLFGTIVLACAVGRFISVDPFRAEIVALVLCAFTLTIAFGRQVALLVTTCVALILTLGLGFSIGEFVTLCSATCAAAVFLGRIRNRTKLVYVGLAAGAIVALTHLGVGAVEGSLHVVSSLPEGVDIESAELVSWRTLLPGLVMEALRLGGFTVLAAALMPALLPIIERVFDVQTDLSLLELGDASHELLRQLAQRAPGTYNHSINVAAISEAAADAIGAHGLLTRVGAYFHDIGKMFKPNYFVENQEQGGNCHDQLQPAMSTLVIIAHVKDGADLARKQRLPKPIIDFIEQHHGTTLVEYFFREAAKRSQENPNKEEVSETSFRYPGPKPQTLEAAVLMLADSVESASRTLVEPTPSRIQNLVDDIAMKKLLDGQFDECGLTLQQLDQVKSSLVKSLTAIYHGRVKYSGQASA